MPLSSTFLRLSYGIAFIKPYSLFLIFSWCLYLDCGVLSWRGRACEAHVSRGQWRTGDPGSRSSVRMFKEKLPKAQVTRM